ncbi:cell wall-binding repeat-containing protein [Leifsonia sp. NPDC058292]|uniref:cell wall-binding repeat-containing protein n=1 Tax=Leifsonia sp. NPDC058292 TaxID=3346428 RepID=UPI0036DD83CD
MNTRPTVRRLVAGIAVAATVVGAAVAAAPATAATSQLAAVATSTPQSAIVAAASLPPAGDPFASLPNLAMDGGTNALYAIVSGSPHSNLAVVDPSLSGKPTMIPLPRVVGDVAVDATRGLAYVSSQDLQTGIGSVLVISTSTKAVVATVSLGAFTPTSSGGTAGIGVDTVTGSIYLAGVDAQAAAQLKVLTAAQIAAAIGGADVTPGSIELPFGNQVTVAVDSSGGIVYATGTSLSGSALFAVNASTDAVVETITLSAQPQTVAVDPSTGTVYVAQGSTASKSIAVVTRGASAIGATIAVPAWARGLDVDPNSGTLFAAIAQPYENGTVNELITISTATNNILTTRPLATPSDVAVDPSTGTAYVSIASAGNPTVLAVREFGVERVSGTDRYATSVSVSQRQFPGTAPVVYVASGADYPDALAAGPAAAKRGGPLLLTAPGALPAIVAAEITRLAPGTIVVAGGAAPVSDAVLKQLHQAAPSATLTRAAGIDRYATSRAVVSDAFTTADTVYLASGTNFPDALSGGGAAGSKGAPTLLVNGSATSVDAATSALLSSLGAKNIVLVGRVVSGGIESSLEDAGYSVARYGGADRYTTALLVNLNTYTHASSAIIAYGLNFPDALSATSWAGMTSSPLYLVSSNCMPQSILSEFVRLGVKTVSLVGGAGVLTANVADLVRCTNL